MVSLIICHYPAELEKFKYILPYLGEVTAIYDTTIGLSNASQWKPAHPLTLQECPVPPRPWWYLLAREADDYKFWQSLPQSARIPSLPGGNS